MRIDCNNMVSTAIRVTIFLIVFVGVTNGQTEVVSTNSTADPNRLIIYVILGAIGLIIITAIFTLLKARVILKDYRIYQNYGKPLKRKFNLYETIGLFIIKQKKIVAAIFIILLMLGGKLTWDLLSGIGVAQGYQPEQPIKFSHKIHAGQNKISCVYCHSGVTKSKTALIPSANVCMNCHKFVREGATTGTAEIAKIYKALDYDPATQKYGANPRPIKWIKVHNLPDLSYFNHSQHVKVGNVDCQKCHGAVEEMDVIQQVAPLTMAWCVNCHRETEVDFANNEYYKTMHDKLMGKFEGQKITVDKLGGLDCARCHY